MDSPVQIVRETEFYHGYIRFKMAISNEAPSVITDVLLDFYFEDALLRIDRHEPEFQLRNGKILLGNIHSGESKSLAVYFDPLLCARGTEINCQVTYRDASGRLGSSFMDPKIVSVVCPMLNTDSDINIGMLKEFIGSLPSRDSKVYEIHQGFEFPDLRISQGKLLRNMMSATSVPSILRTDGIARSGITERQKSSRKTL